VSVSVSLLFVLVPYSAAVTTTTSTTAVHAGPWYFLIFILHHAQSSLMLILNLSLLHSLSFIRFTALRYFPQCLLVVVIIANI
jgi:hypothetical protein